MKAQMTGAKFIAYTFKQKGITHIFYVEAILRRSLVEMEKLGIKRILTHSEKAAAYMADGYARVSRRPGIAMAQSVGAANLAAGLQDPYLGLSPVIAITGRKPHLYQYRNAYQEIHHNEMFKPITKFHARIDTIDQLPYLLRQAFREVTSGIPRPVHLDMLGYEGELIDEISLLNQEILAEKRFSEYPAYRCAPESDLVNQAANIISETEKVVIVAGYGAQLSGAGEEISQLAEALQIPVATSLGAKGIIPDNHPLCAGVVGSYCRWCANQIVAEAELVMFIGSCTGDQVTNNWKVPAEGTSVIQIDVDPSELGHNYPNLLGILGDPKVTTANILKELTPRKSPTSWTMRCKRIIKNWEEEVEAQRCSDAYPIIPERLCKEISDNIPHDAVLVVDTGFAGVWSASMIKILHPNQKFIRAAGSLGWAFPAALGAKCSVDERTVICFIGDGGFLYHIAELETASRWGINIVVVVNNNHSLGQCLRGINRAYGSDEGKKEDMYVFREINFANIAKEFGCAGIRVERPYEINPALQNALSLKKPTVIDVVTKRDHMAPFPPPDF